MDEAAPSGADGTVPPPSLSGYNRSRIASFVSASFDQPVGTRIVPAEARGYYLDLRVKADAPRWPESWIGPSGSVPWVTVSQVGLGCFERYLLGEGEEWLAAAREGADRVIGARRPDGGLEHRFPMPHTFRVEPPWISGMAQGQAASLLARIYAETGEERYADEAAAILGPLTTPTSSGGAMAELGGQLLPEEYPTDPPSLVLNGAIFGTWGIYDVDVCLGREVPGLSAQVALDALAENLWRYDTGWWSLYDLYPHRVRNVASLAYHRLHIDQLRATGMLAGNAAFGEVQRRFEAYERSLAGRGRAFASKARFRVLSPRDARLARLVSSWRRGGG